MDHIRMESRISKFWKDNCIFKKSVEQRPTGRQYVFYDGPPFATGLPHYGHILGLTSKDLFPRYWTMKGYRVERRWGWDCHGLPIENIAEKELGIREKKGIEEMGIAKFNEFCRSKVLYFSNEWKKTVDRMGKWIEFDNAYKTMDRDYMETVWWIFKRLYEQDHIFEGKKVLMYCPRCETPLSNAEIAMDNSYKDITERSATVKFKIRGEKNMYILAWTTTPWTLIGNVALAVNPNLKYVKVLDGDAVLIVAKERLEALGISGTVVEEFDGGALVGKEYEPLYIIEAGEKGHYVIDGGDEVSASEGTGIVHMALYGDFDYRMVQKHKLPVIQHIGRDGRLVKGPVEWLGRWFKDVDRDVLKDLEGRGLLFSAENYTHSYPFCYRCDTPLFYNAVDSWFIDIQGAKERLLERNRDITWHPEHIKEGRFRNIIETAPDWSISRNRFWATAIPVWKCVKGCGHTKVIGSIQELKENSIEELSDDAVDLHKHVVDGVRLRCACGGEMKRIPEVIDCWFESGAMPYAAKHYPFENEEWFKSNFPCDFVSEYVGQVRAWFYYMHVMGVLLFGKPPFKHVVVTGNILAEDGTKMSKSKGNFPDPALIFDKYGADTLRFYLMASPVSRANDINFSEEGLKEAYRKVMMLTDNICSFYRLFSEGNKVFDDSSSGHLLDRWIVGRLNATVKSTTECLDDYDTVGACAEITGLVSDISTWYVRRSRERFKSGDESVRGPAVRTLAHVLHTLSKIMAPITPFIAEDMHQVFRAAQPKLAESVHLEGWPAYYEDPAQDEMNEKMGVAREIVSMALEEREKARIPVRQALSRLTVKGAVLGEEYLELIREEVNVRHVALEGGDTLGVKLDTEITPELRMDGIARDVIRKLNNERKAMGLTISDRIVLGISTNDAEVAEAIGKHGDDICRSVQADELKIGEFEGGKSIRLAQGAEILVGIYRKEEWQDKCHFRRENKWLNAGQGMIGTKTCRIAYVITGGADWTAQKHL